MAGNDTCGLGRYGTSFALPIGMRLSSTALNATAMAGVVSVVIAAAILGMLLTDPVGVASVAHGNLAPLLHSLARAIADTIAALVRYL